MQISSIFCRAQEAQQNQRAADSGLANVKTIALGAAAAWRVEAIAAERREDRRSRIAGDDPMPETDSVSRDESDPDFDESN
jgi:hypothetical protein